MEHPIQGLMKATMENLKEMVDVNTIIGEPVQTTDGGVILTVSKVSFGYGAGGSDFSADQSTKENHLAFGGGSAGGVSITPVAFLVVNNDGVNIMHLQNGTHLAEKIIELAPQTFSKIQTMFSQNNATNTTNAANMANPMNAANMTTAPNMTNQANMTAAPNMTNQANMTAAPNMTNPTNMTTAPNMTSATDATNMTNQANTTNMTAAPNTTSATDTTHSANTTITTTTTTTTNPVNATSSVEEKMQTTEQDQDDIL